MYIFENTESNVRSYCRHFPALFVKAKDSALWAEDGRKYIDFFSGAGALNYGHNNDYIKSRLIDYLKSDGLAHALDMYTAAKRDFLVSFCDNILSPRGMNYKVQFCGPTGANGIEAALKLARRVKGRTGVFAFSGSFHGMSLGSLALTSSNSARAAAGVSLNNVVFMPYPHGFNLKFDTIEYLENILTDDHSGIEKPAAIFVETVQAEGGIVVASSEWLKELSRICAQFDILLVCDDIQVGCGRTGTFFSFERAGIIPDMVILSKSISGYGLPMTIVLMKPELDLWQPGEHTGTFRGNQLSFIGAKASIDFWVSGDIEADVTRNSALIEKFLFREIAGVHSGIDIRGIGMIWGIDLNGLAIEGLAKTLADHCFGSGLVIETAGRKDNVLKLLPPLNISESELLEGLEIIRNSLLTVITCRSGAKSSSLVSG